MRLYILRHAESLSYSDQVDFEKDPGLSPLGITQAELTAKKIQNLGIERIITSSAKRAVETAQIINMTLRKRIEFSEEIKEIRPPKIEVKNERMQFLNILNNLKDKEEDDEPEIDDRRDASFIEVEKRSTKFLSTLQYFDKTTLIITHSAFSRILTLQMLLGEHIFPEQVKSLHIDHAGLTTCIKDEDVWRLLTWNDNTHLGQFMSKNRF